MHGNTRIKFAGRFINVTCFYRPLSVSIKFFEMTDRFGQGDVVYGALLPLTEATLCVVVAFLSSGGPLLVSLMFIDTEVLLTIR